MSELNGISNRINKENFDNEYQETMVNDQLAEVLNYREKDSKIELSMNDEKKGAVSSPSAAQQGAGSIA